MRVRVRLDRSEFSKSFSARLFDGGHEMRPNRCVAGHVNCHVSHVFPISGRMSGHNRGSQCEHGRRRSTCRKCGGSDICEHDRVRYTCNECGGSGVCEHGRRRATCKLCGGNGVCKHGRQRNQCKQCGGSQICEHRRRRAMCKECGGSGICEHGRQRRQCEVCGGSRDLASIYAAALRKQEQGPCAGRGKSSLVETG